MQAVNAATHRAAIGAEVGSRTNRGVRHADFPTRSMKALSSPRAGLQMSRLDQQAAISDGWGRRCLVWGGGFAAWWGPRTGWWGEVVDEGVSATLVHRPFDLERGYSTVYETALRTVLRKEGAREAARSWDGRPRAYLHEPGQLVVVHSSPWSVIIYEPRPSPPLRPPKPPLCGRQPAARPWTVPTPRPRIEKISAAPQVIAEKKRWACGGREHIVHPRGSAPLLSGRTAAADASSLTRVFLVPWALLVLQGPLFVYVAMKAPQL